jgi:thiamine kinase-like enzyme
LEVELDDDQTLRLVFKNMSKDALLESARRARPRFVYDPQREIKVYQNLLSSAELGTATFYGSVADPQAQQYWLFIEKVPGLALYQIGEFDVWEDVARWLARMHKQFRTRGHQERGASYLLKYDADLYWTWIRRAQTFFRSDSSAQNNKGTESKIERLIAGFDQVVEKLTALPQTFIHGEFYASNVLIHDRPEGLRVCPVDWEMAAVGPELIDLAALTAGNWTDEQRMAIALAYHSEVKSDAEWGADPGQLLVALEYCRLQQAVHWLGWFGRRRPYWQHAQEWLSEAMRIADKLGL